MNEISSRKSVRISNMWRPVLLLFAVTASADYFNSQTPILKLDGFYTYDEMRWYLKTLSNSFRNVELRKLTETYEFRNVYMVKITAPQDYHCAGPKKVILLDAATQGNEWMTTSVALKVIHELVVNYEANKMLLERFDWYILPMVNPDGYEYSQHPLSHFWKKNRSPNSFNYGTNLNRNFNSNWDKLYQENSLPISQQFRGNSSFSERESNILASLMKSLLEQNQHFLSVTLQTKSSPSILYPSPLETMPPNEIKIFKMVAEYASKNIYEDTKPVYLHIPPTEYKRLGGTSLDYAYLQGFPLTFALEVFEAKEFKGNPRIFIDERVFVGWSGVFHLVVGALNYKCNVPEEEKCNCLYEEDYDDDFEFIDLQSVEFKTSVPVKVKPSGAAKLNPHLSVFCLLWLCIFLINY